MQIPQRLIQSLQGINGFDQDSFIEAHTKPASVTSVRLNSSKITSGIQAIFNEDLVQKKVPWCKSGYYLEQRPSFTFDPLFHAGCYYVQEASSMFLEQALMQTVDLDQPLKVLDLCAAPGGKSTHLQSLISAESILVSNEVIRSRTSALKDNIIKWGCENVLVTNNDPADFSKLKSWFDVIVIDAPCSGSGLFRRDAGAINEWSEGNVELCSQRQQRILADALPALKQNGVLVYSTCSYSSDENEKIVDWLCQEFELESCRLSLPVDWNITEIETPVRKFGYRFWPHLVKGEGFFLSVFKKKREEHVTKPLKQKTKPVGKSEMETLEKWVYYNKYRFVSFGEMVYAWPEALFADFDALAQQLKVIYSGVAIGELVRDKLIPAHALSMNDSLLNDTVERIELDEYAAISYLQRRDISPDVAVKKGWQMVCFKGHPLGWVNVLQNRINNYYPKELRILKDR